MQRKRGELVPIAEVFSDLPGPVKALRKTPPPARRGFTQADQVNQLVEASEADPDLGFMGRTMALCPPFQQEDQAGFSRERETEKGRFSRGGGLEKKFHNPFPPLSLLILAPFQEQGQGPERKPRTRAAPERRTSSAQPHDRWSATFITVILVAVRVVVSHRVCDLAAIGLTQTRTMALWTPWSTGRNERSTSIGSQSTGTGSDSSSRRSRAARPPRLSHSSVW